MNNLILNPVGLDDAIKSVQVDLYNELTKLWGDVDGFGRVYKTPVNNGEEIPKYYQTSKIVIPEWYNAATDDYEDVYYNDNKSASFCFLTQENDTTEDGMVFLSDVKCVFMMDLSKVYSSSVSRQDSRAQSEVVKILRNFNFGRYKIIGIERRIDFIFREYFTQNIKFNDMHPFHCFAVKIKLKYDLTDNCI